MKRLLTALVIFGIGLAAGIQAADLQVGDMAPDFSLKASDGHLYKLSDFKGKRAVVIAWYPKAFTLKTSRRNLRS